MWIISSLINKFCYQHKSDVVYRELLLSKLVFPKNCDQIIYVGSVLIFIFQCFLSG